MSTGARVVRLGAWCDVDDFTWRMHAAGRLTKAMNFDVHEFAVLDDGRRLALRQDRGWGHALSVHGDDSTSRDPWDHLTEAAVRRDVLIAVLPDVLEDDAEPDDAVPDGRLSSLLTLHGAHATADALRALPYDVELGPHLRDHLGPGATSHPPTS